MCTSRSKYESLLAILEGHIRRPQRNLTISTLYSNGLIATIKNKLEPEQWTNKKQEFRQWTQ